uniref:Uncharacterized protein n=1 Tax=Meloidogyne enterolobii TaxID=390850 RepID=A0A6V7UC64_MELEN|nr:unnamed protein product [Meloidogyne enterolobii]
MKFFRLKNKWSRIYCKCCNNKCINTDNPIGNCANGNGFVNIINDENIKYISCLEGKGGQNVSAYVYAKNSFTKPRLYLHYSLYYFEIKCIFEEELGEKWLNIGLEKCGTHERIKFTPRIATVFNEEDEDFKPDKTCKTNDIFGVGLVYPPTNRKNEWPYIFITKNGKQIVFNENIFLFSLVLFNNSTSISIN